MSQNYATKLAPAISPNGQKTAISLPKKAQGSFWDRIAPKWEKLIVEGREVKGFVISPAIAGIFLVFFLGLASTVYWRLSDKLSDQHDLIIELKTSLKDKSEYDARQIQAAKDAAELASLKAENASKELATIKGMLSVSERRVLQGRN